MPTTIFLVVLGLIVLSPGAIGVLHIVTTALTSRAIPGQWKWGTRVIHFNSDGGVAAPANSTNGDNSISGGWEVNGRKVHFWTVIIDGENPGWEFELSSDNKNLKDSGNPLNWHDEPVMTKISDP